MEDLLKDTLVTLTSQIPDSAGLRGSLRIFISNKFPGHPDAAGLGTTFQ